MKFSLYFIILLSVANSQNIEQVKRQLKNSDIAKEELIKMSNDQGISNNQIESKLNESKNDIDDSRNKLNNDQPFDLDDKNENSVNEVESDDANQEDQVIADIIINDEEEELVYFGYQIFSGNPDAFQSSAFGAVDPNYNIGPGDQIIVMLWGESQFRQEFIVDREGYIFVPEVGQVFVNGLILEDLEKKLFQILSKVYSTLKPSSGKPTTFMDISLGNLRPLRIIVLGEVLQPGAYSVSPSTSLSSSLYYFNGPSTSGSLREIRLIRNGNLIGNIDFYNYLLSGKTPNDIRLQIDDIVFIPHRGKTVTIKGEINRSGIYELKDNEGLKELLYIVGGLSPSAYVNRAQINRIVPNNERSTIGMDRIILDINLQSVLYDNKYIELHDGDFIEIFPIENEHKNYVTINSSSVARPGKYQLIPGMTVIELIEKAEGILNNAFLEMAHIKRIKDDLTEELISINLKMAFNGDSKHDIVLKYMDELIIYDNNKLKNLYTNILINGPLKNPGSYVLEENKTIGDLIVATGGFKKNIKKVKISIARKNSSSFNPEIFYFPRDGSYIEIIDLEDPLNVINQFNLESSDLISVYSDPKDNISNTVLITGSVFYPGIYPIISNKEKVSDIIKRAGGLRIEANPMSSTFIRNKKTIKLSFSEILKKPNSKQNFTIMKNDQINIGSKSNIVEILGEVNQPGIYKYIAGYSLRKYLDHAGGLTTDAETKEIWVTHSNGISKQLKPFMISPKIYDGSVINVKKEKEVEPFDKTEFAKEIASIMADFLQIYISLAVLMQTANNTSS